MTDIVKDASEAIGSLVKDGKGNIRLTTSKIRKILSIIGVLRNKINIFKLHHYGEKNLSEELVREVKFLGVTLAYESGRDIVVKDFVEKTKLSTKVNDVGSSIEKFDELCKYVEALVAYHKYSGGRD